MICTCRSCHQSFWRYRRDFPPSGFCSLPCHEIGPTRQAEADAPPPMPETVLRDMRAHRIRIHRTDSMLGWYQSCATCNELEADYAASLEYHLDAATAEIAVQAKRRWAGASV